MARVVHIHPLDVYERLQKGEPVQVIDVREAMELAEGKIPGAKHIPLGQIPQRMHEISRDKAAVIVCRSGSRSHMACEFLASNGFSNVHNMLGGMNAWSWDVE